MYISKGSIKKNIATEDFKIIYFETKYVDIPDKLILYNKEYLIYPVFYIFIKKNSSYEIVSSCKKSLRVYKKKKILKIDIIKNFFMKLFYYFFLNYGLNDTNFNDGKIFIISKDFIVIFIIYLVKLFYIYVLDLSSLNEFNQDFNKLFKFYFLKYSFVIVKRLLGSLIKRFNRYISKWSIIEQTMTLNIELGFDITHILTDVFYNLFAKYFFIDNTTYFSPFFKTIIFIAIPPFLHLLKLYYCLIPEQEDLSVSLGFDAYKLGSYLFIISGLIGFFYLFILLKNNYNKNKKIIKIDKYTLSKVLSVDKSYIFIQLLLEIFFGIYPLNYRILSDKFNYLTYFNQKRDYFLKILYRLNPFYWILLDSVFFLDKNVFLRIFRNFDKTGQVGANFYKLENDNIEYIGYKLENHSWSMETDISLKIIYLISEILNNSKRNQIRNLYQKNDISNINFLTEVLNIKESVFYYLSKIPFHLVLSIILK